MASKGKGKDISPLLSILGGLIGGGSPSEGEPGGLNPAAGAKGPEDVDYSYKGDPSEAMSKFGTTNTTVPLGFWGKLFNPQLASSIQQSNLAASVANKQADIQAQRELAIKAAGADQDRSRAIAIAKNVHPEMSDQEAGAWVDTHGTNNVLGGAGVAKARLEQEQAAAKTAGVQANEAEQLSPSRLQAGIAQYNASTAESKVRQATAEGTLPTAKPVASNYGELARLTSEGAVRKQPTVNDADLAKAERDRTLSQAGAQNAGTEAETNTLGTAINRDIAANKYANLPTELETSNQMAEGRKALVPLSLAREAYDKANVNLPTNEFVTGKVTPGPELGSFVREAVRNPGYIGNPQQTAVGDVTSFNRTPNLAFPKDTFSPSGNSVLSGNITSNNGQQPVNPAITKPVVDANGNTRIQQSDGTWLVIPARKPLGGGVVAPSSEDSQLGIPSI